jgi:ATP-dependent helicase HrpA
VVGGGLRKACHFLDHIDEMRSEIEAIEQKLRRPGGLWSDEAVVRFFEDRIPHEINTASAFHKWLEKYEETLLLAVADVVDESLEDLGLDGFPDTLRYSGDEYTLYYHALAGERDDGVTLGLHVDQLPKLPDWLPGWGVDGNLRERAEILLRSLPKDYRRICQPIGPVAEGFAECWMYAPKDMSIFQALSEYAKERTGAHVPLDAYDVSKLPPELVTKIWVCDDDGQELAMGTEVAVLKIDLADRMRVRFEAIANSDIERKGISTWDGESLPERVETPGGAAFPALVDEGKTVGVRAFTCLAEANESHRAGGARLLCLTHADQVNHLLKKFPLGMMAKVELPRLGVAGTAMNDLILLAAEGAAGKVFPRSPDAFRVLAQEARGRWFDAANAVGKSLDESLELLPEIRAWIERNRKDRNLGGVAEDLEEELTWLFRQRFAWHAGFAVLRDYPRRLKAIRSRLARVSSLPLVKDLEKMERLRKAWLPWFRAWTKDPDDCNLWQLGWMLEEYRISLFAPDIPLTMKVSEKRVQELLRTSALL